MKTDSHAGRAAIASMWNYSTRALGLGWAALMVAKLGIGDYGLYALGVAATGITHAAIDNAFYVRSLRIDEHRYQRERCARVLVGALLAIVGVCCFLQWYVVGFGITMAAGEMFFLTFKSQFLRAGRPDIANRFDAIRQIASIGLGAAYLLFADDPQLLTATALYLAPYSVIMLTCFTYLPGRRPAKPGDSKEIFVLSSEAFSLAVYLQADLLVLGLLAGEKVTGYYALALVTATAISTIGQNYATTFIQHMRDSNGALGSTPPIASILKVGMFTGAAMAVVGAGILISGRADNLGIIALIMSLWVASRAIQHNFIVILFLQRRDSFRVGATATAAIVKTALLFPAVHIFGGYGAAVIGVICELTLNVVYYRKIFHHRAEVVDYSNPGALQR